MLGRLGTLLLTWFEGARRSRMATLAIATLVVSILAAGSALAAPSASIVVDAKTGKILYSSNADAQRFPASLTKMMTLYLLFEAIDSGETSLTSRITMSKFAASQPPSKLGIKAGKTITVRDAILALVTRSANDVATAVAEHLAGSEKAFARRMTERALQLGMTRTTFRNSHGLPNSAQVTTARDMATLGRALKEHFPQYYSYFATPSFVWQGTRISNHNRLLGRVSGVDGIKTGYTRASGYNLVSSVDRNGRQIVAVVMGGSSGKARDQRMAGLIDTYLPRASRGAHVAFIPRIGGAVVTQVALSEYPMPRLRPRLSTIPNEAPAPTVVATAEAAAAPLALAPTAEEDGAFAANSIAQLVGANSIFALAADGEQQEGDTGIEDATDVAEPAATVDLTGWKIQLAATPSQQSAEELLGRAAAKGSAVLADAAPYTEPVEAGAGMLYRARFAGFADKAEARAACEYLAKHNFNCLAIAN